MYEHCNIIMNMNRFFFCKFIRSLAIALLCGSPLEVCAGKVPCLVQHASAIQEKYTKLFTLFGRCHRGYAMKVFTADDIERLGKEISAIPTMTSISYVAKVIDSLHLI